MNCEIHVHAVLTKRVLKNDEQAKKAFLNLERFHGVNPKELASSNMMFLVKDHLTQAVDGKEKELKYLTFDSVLCDIRRL